jgi:FkbM family methyltransferase
MSVRRPVRRMIEKALHAQVVPIGHVALAFEWEHLRRFFAHFAIDCVFDVGANAGQYATMLRTRVGYRGHIISYEPIPELAAKIRAAATVDRGWFVEEMALDAVQGHASFNIFASDQFSSLHAASAAAEHQFQENVRLNRRIEVRTGTLANEFVKYQTKLGFKRPFLKMDTQGHDVSVAVGAGDRLRDFVGLQSELAIGQLYIDAPGYVEVLEFYRGRGFELSALVPNNLGHFPRLLEIDCIMFRPDGPD